ncbi:MAG: ATP-binding protein [Lachnospiraceae bacterium]|nr:ATP-binding protein [Lachnospiraceae bacterium]
MPLTNSQYDTIIRTYEEQQLRERNRRDERIRQVNRQIKGYEKISHEIASLSVEHARLLLDGDESALNRLKSSLLLLRKKQEELLEEAGLGKDYLKPAYVCTLCRDTGYINNRKCSCFKQKMIDLLYEQSNMKELLEKQNFSRLSYEYYVGEDLSRFEKAVSTCHSFVKSFDSDYHNLFFYGTVGTGKSFLSGCIAKELIDSGHSVIYFSAVALFDRISRHTFDYQAKDELNDLYEDLYSCDLLIIDDLGTEVTNAFSSSQFFSCLNERILRKKSIIISTNLSLQELRDRYSDRIFSRITSNFDLCKITGPDIRMHKKRLTIRK